MGRTAHEPVEPIHHHMLTPAGRSDLTRHDAKPLPVVEHGGDKMLPRIGIMQALHRRKASPEPTPRKKRPKEVQGRAITLPHPYGQLL
jgi:hypothetical protein